jgi:hypothetical protein
MGYGCFQKFGLESWGVLKNVPERLLGTRFTNAISCIEPGPEGPYREIFLKHPTAYNQVHNCTILTPSDLG